MVCQAIRSSAQGGCFHFAQKAELVAQMMVCAVPARGRGCHGGRGPAGLGGACSGRPTPTCTGVESWLAAWPDGRLPQRKAGALAKG